MITHELKFSTTTTTLHKGRQKGKDGIYSSAALESLKESNYVKYVILRSELCCAIYPTSPAAIVGLSKLV